MQRKAKCNQAADTVPKSRGRTTIFLEVAIYPFSSRARDSVTLCRSVCHTSLFFREVPYRVAFGLVSCST